MMTKKFRKVDAYTNIYVNDTLYMKAVCIVDVGCTAKNLRNNTSYILDIKIIFIFDICYQQKGILSLALYKVGILAHLIDMSWKYPAGFFQVVGVRIARGSYVILEFCIAARIFGEVN